jgi:hypothetical protein
MALPSTLIAQGFVPLVLIGSGTLNMLMINDALWQHDYGISYEMALSGPVVSGDRLPMPMVVRCTVAHEGDLNSKITFIKNLRARLQNASELQITLDGQLYIRALRNGGYYVMQDWKPSYCIVQIVVFPSYSYWVRGGNPVYLGV